MNCPGAAAEAAPAIAVVSSTADTAKARARLKWTRFVMGRNYKHVSRVGQTSRSPDATTPSSGNGQLGMGRHERRGGPTEACNHMAHARHFEPRHGDEVPAEMRAA